MNGLRLVCLALVLGLAANEGHACNGRKSGARSAAIAYQTGPTTWNVCVPGWVTLAIARGNYCAVGLSVPGAGSITSVDSVAMYDERNSATIQQLSYSRNTSVGANFNAASTGNWTGFLAQASGPIAAGVPNMYCFRITTKSGTTFPALQAELRVSKVGSDSADAQGKLGGGSGQVIFNLSTVTADTSAHNPRIFHNSVSATISTRVTADGADTIYFMQPRDFRYGQGDATGWVGRFQDQDPSTAEVIALSYTKYAGATSDLPDVTAAGQQTRVEFTLFGAGGARAADFTLTTAGKIPIDRFIGIGAMLPAPRSWPDDGITIPAQEGNFTKTPVTLHTQWTYRLQGAAAASFLPKNTTLHLGGLYDCATCQLFAFSNAYGESRRLFGAESIRPDNVQGRADLIGFRIRTERFKLQPAVVMLAPDYAPVPIKTLFKDYLIGTFFTTVVFAIDSEGIGTSIGFGPLDKSIQLAAQGVLLDFVNLDLVFTDASRVRIQP